MRRALAIDEKSFGPEHPNVAIRLNNLAQLLQATNRLAEAEPLMRRALAIDEKSFGPEHPNVAIRLNNLAAAAAGHQPAGRGRAADAPRARHRREELRSRPSQRRHHAQQPGPAAAGHQPAGRGRAADAPCARHRREELRARPSQRRHRPQQPGRLLQATNRLAEAEPLMRRALAIDEKSSAPSIPSVATALNNLAELLRATNRLAEAEPLMRRALAIDEKSFGPDHPDVASDLNNLAQLLQATNRLAEAEPLYRRALAIDEKSFGLDHPNVARDLNNLAMLLQATNRLAEAEPLYRRALAIFEKSLGADHPNVANSLNNLAWLLAEGGDWAAAAALGRRAKPILIGRGAADGSGDRNGLGTALLTSNTWALRAHARAEHRANAGNAVAREEGFDLAQWALQTSAAQALSQMSARSAKGTGPLAQLVRERQDAVARRAAEDKQPSGCSRSGRCTGLRDCPQECGFAGFGTRCPRCAALERVQGIR